MTTALQNESAGVSGRLFTCIATTPTTNNKQQQIIVNKLQWAAILYLSNLHHREGNVARPHTSNRRPLESYEQPAQNRQMRCLPCHLWLECRKSVRRKHSQLNTVIENTTLTKSRTQQQTKPTPNTGAQSSQQTRCMDRYLERAQTPDTQRRPSHQTAAPPAAHDQATNKQQTT